MTKNSKLQLCRQHFLLEASIHQPPNIVLPKEHAVGTAAILDFNVNSITLIESLPINCDCLLAAKITRTPLIVKPTIHDGTGAYNKCRCNLLRFCATCCIKIKHAL